MRATLWAAILGAAVALAPSGAKAHPHVWVDSATTFVFDQDRRLVELRHRWRFDEIFGSFVMSEFDENQNGRFDGDEVAKVRADGFQALEEFGYFTIVRIDGERVPIEDVVSFEARIEERVLVYEFGLGLPEPVDPAERDVVVGVYDPAYYVEVLLDEHDPVRFEGLPSGACIFDLHEDREHPIYYGMVFPLVIALSCATS